MRKYLTYHNLIFTAEGYTCDVSYDMFMCVSEQIELVSRNVSFKLYSFIHKKLIIFIGLKYMSKRSTCDISINNPDPFISTKKSKKIN